MTIKNMDGGAAHERSYRELGFAAQRRYPNEELLRFMGRRYFGIPREARSAIRMLEVGCGSGANLWMIAREGFEAHGLEISVTGVKLCEDMLHQWGTVAAISVGDMTSIPYPDRHFDAVIDVYSAYCLTEAQFGVFLNEAARVLKPGGRFFAYTPAKNSDAFRNPGASQLIDPSTLEGITRPTAAYTGSHYPFRFITGEEHAKALEQRGLSVSYNEAVSRTYQNGREYFEFVVIEAQRS